MPSHRLALDTPSNIRGAAALLALYGAGLTRRSPLEAWEAALARLSGIAGRDIAQIHTYDIYMAIREGRQGQDFAVTRHPIDLARIYGQARLDVLSARVLHLADHPDALFERLRAAGVPMVRFGASLWPGVDASVCANSVALGRRLFGLPVHQELRAPERAWLAATVRRALEETAGEAP
jgi:hypothetical protein